MQDHTRTRAAEAAHFYIQVEARLPAHAGGVLTLDMRGDMVVTAGLGLRHGQPIVERAVRVFDLRGAPRLLASVRATVGQHVSQVYAISPASKILPQALRRRIWVKGVVHTAHKCFDKDLLSIGQSMHTDHGPSRGERLSGRCPLLLARRWWPGTPSSPPRCSSPRPAACSRSPTQRATAMRPRIRCALLLAGRCMQRMLAVQGLLYHCGARACSRRRGLPHEDLQRKRKHGIKTISLQVLTEGDALVDCTISSTGEAIAFGGSGGYVHLWSSAQQLVAVNRFSEVQRSSCNICMRYQRSHAEWALKCRQRHSYPRHCKAVRLWLQEDDASCAMAPCAALCIQPAG